MKTIFKYNIGTDTMEIPKGAEILSYQSQGHNLCIWALVDPEAPKQTRRFRIMGTGQEVPHGYSYIGTTQQGPYVWHLFEDRYGEVA